MEEEVEEVEIGGWIVVRYITCYLRSRSVGDGGGGGGGGGVRR